MYRFQRKNDSIWLLGKNKEVKFKPTKVVCVGLNYKAHAKELNMDIPKEPLLFLKPTSSIILDQEDIIYPRASTRVDYEGELAIVISKTSKKLSYKDAKDAILGFCIANDVTARDLQKKDIQFTRSKSFDTFCPVGPAIVKDVDPFDLNIKTYLNNQLKQQGNTSDMIFDVYEIVSFVSHIMSLYPHDIIITGTPPGVGPMQIGDKVSIEIEGIGILTNIVKEDVEN
ncbi:5-carboxymethyl-2-hydroxymuconate Delta-isomerase [Hydrogenobaculum sp. Y04AAS1]|uniref:fumarylacetoacetate hydrolase family protein n=1 Tax=Hydrogenobaculum sp. (strain Y04AAS1) TaxID=380749 RepID=UPI00015BCC44|nr:5-carboxymethyl-2-hydroxymuconate Delta-isomerase [Hydrogenobaculum sp. Y04AAS1]HCT66432.1 FAA hydrolase family protein [Hydrogenobaculum sp.]